MLEEIVSSHIENGVTCTLNQSNDTRATMINLKWSRRHSIRWGDNGNGQDFRNRKRLRSGGKEW